MENRVVMVSGTPFPVSAGLWHHLDSLAWSEHDVNGQVHLINVDPSVFRWIVIYEQGYKLPREATQLPDLYSLATLLELRALLVYLDDSRQKATDTGLRRSFKGIRRMTLKRSSSGRDVSKSNNKLSPECAGSIHEGGYRSSHDLQTTFTDGIHKGRKENEFKRANSLGRLKVALPRSDSLGRLRKNRKNKNNSYSSGSTIGSWETSASQHSEGSRSLIGGSERGDYRGKMKKSGSFRLPSRDSFRRKSNHQQQPVVMPIAAEFGVM